MPTLIHNSKFTIGGTVVRGEGYGKVLGFPTANLDRREYVRRKLKIKLGVWAGFAKINSKFEIRNSKQSLSIKDLNSKLYKAGIVIGPLDRHRLPKIEAHLVGFKGSLYGRKLVIHLNKYIRPFKRYKNIEDLKKAIKQDIERVKKL